MINMDHAQNGAYQRSQYDQWLTRSNGVAHGIRTARADEEHHSTNALEHKRQYGTYGVRLVGCDVSTIRHQHQRAYHPEVNFALLISIVDSSHLYARFTSTNVLTTLTTQ